MAVLPPQRTAGAWRLVVVSFVLVQQLFVLIVLVVVVLLVVLLILVIVIVVLFVLVFVVFFLVLLILLIVEVVGVVFGRHCEKARDEIGREAGAWVAE
jgi:hypothetical protein